MTPNIVDLNSGKRSPKAMKRSTTTITEDEVTEQDQVVVTKDSFDVEVATKAANATDANAKKLNIFSPGKNCSADQEHLGEGRQYWRDIILGVNDGLVSTFLLVAGVTGANLSNKDILLTAVSGTIAGAISMAAGEYVATKSQQEVMDGEIALERQHIQHRREEELAELVAAFTKIGIPQDSNEHEVEQLRKSLMAYYSANDDAHLQVQTVLEHGVLEEEKRSPYVAGGVSFFLFFFGALPSVIPFACTKNNQAALFAAGAATIAALFLVGAAKTWATRGSWYVSAIENLLIAAGGGSIAYAVGFIFEKLVHDN